MKAFLCLASALFALSACATSTERAQPSSAQSATTEPAKPAATPAPQQQEKPAAAPASNESGPTTAAEAAERVHEEWVRTHGGRSGGGSGGSGGDAPSGDADDAPCSSDDQCALTRVARGGCCETLCVPRAVTRARADALSARQPSCAQGRACPDISCHPQGQSVAVKCDAGRCVARRVSGSRQ